MLEIKHLKIDFERGQSRFWGRDRGYQSVVEDFNLAMRSGEIVGIVGESGSGKTVTALSIMGVLPAQARVNSGSILFHDEDLLSCNEKTLRRIQGREMTMIFQEPMTSLNPVLKIGRQLEEPLRLHYKELSAKERKEQALKVLHEVEIKAPEQVYSMYPHQLSGGMRQRVMIGMALICKPRLLIADEPTTALDVSTQAQIIQLLLKINRKRQTGILFISHNLGVVKQICERVLVMKQGQIIEAGLVDEVFTNPQTEYTKLLISSIPSRTKRIRKVPDQVV